MFSLPLAGGCLISFGTKVKKPDGSKRDLNLNAEA
jgi:hypothetical protein